MVILSGDQDIELFVHSAQKLAKFHRAHFLPAYCFRTKAMQSFPFTMRLSASASASRCRAMASFASVSISGNGTDTRIFSHASGMRISGPALPPELTQPPNIGRRQLAAINGAVFFTLIFRQPFL